MDRELISKNKLQNSKFYEGKKEDINIKLEYINKENLSNEDLSNLYFYNCIINESIFRKANLTNCRFIECTIKNCNFSRANLTNTEFSRCSIINNDFRNTEGNLETIMSYVSNNAGF